MIAIGKSAVVVASRSFEGFKGIVGVVVNCGKVVVTACSCLDIREITAIILEITAINLGIVEGVVILEIVILEIIVVIVIKTTTVAVNSDYNFGN